MFGPGGRKLSQMTHTSTAVNAICRSHAEPERTASFTYLQIQAQVVHFIPFQGVVLPLASLGVFSTVDGAHSGCYEAFSLICRALRGPVKSRSTLVYSMRCNTLGKIKTYPHNPPLFRPNKDTLFSLFEKGILVSSFLQMESLKVIALDKFSVNLNFPHIFQKQQIH